MTDGTKNPASASRKPRFIEFSTTVRVACGRCAEDCVEGVLTMHGGLPQAVEEKSGFCVRCGHCVSVCPVNAITLDSRNSSELRHLTDFCTGEAGLSLLWNIFAIIAVRLRPNKKVQNLNRMWYKSFAQHIATQGDFGLESP